MERALRRIGPRRETGRAVHEARRSLKRARADLRLGRAAFGAAVVHRENSACRRAARMLAPARDADVFAASVGRILQRRRRVLTSAQYSSGRLLAAAARREALRALADEVVRGRAFGLLRGCRDRLAACALAPAGRPALEAQARRALARAVTAWRGVRAAPSAATYHGLRKAVQRLRYSLEWLSPAGREAAARISDLHELSDALGEEHDLAEFRRRLAGRPFNPSARDLRRFARIRQVRLRERALRLGRGLFERSSQSLSSAFSVSCLTESKASRDSTIRRMLA
ncbi:MAG: CHAD domain-containing protein [Elusimicrobiota bacterium]